MIVRTAIVDRPGKVLIALAIATMAACGNLAE